jgi:uncharacterized glyoxalase superfamily protein PhnB
MAKGIPEGLHTVTPGLSMDGAAEAIDFYRKAFGAEEISRAPDPSGKKIWHAEIRIGDSAIFVNDLFPEMGMGGPPQHASLWVYTDNVDAAFERARAAGAEVKMAPADMFWGDRMCQVADRWGNSWSLATRREIAPEAAKAAEAKAVAEWKARAQDAPPAKK